MTNLIFFLPFVSFLISLVSTPVVIRVAYRLGLVDDPSIRYHPGQVHKKAVPRAGGISIFLGLFIPIFLFLTTNTLILTILASCLILLAVGIWDDIKDRSPYIRLTTNLIAACLVVSQGVTIPYITNPLGGVIKLDSIVFKLNILGNSLTVAFFSTVLALLWIVWVTNIVGWSGGVDGQLPGFVSISAIVIGILSLRYSLDDPSQLFVTYLSFATAGSFLGFLPWNFHPQKIMPGYGGKTIAGFMLAVLSILSFAKLGTAILVLALPLTDACFIFVKRLLSGKSPVWAGSEHLHHHLLALNISKKKIAYYYWLISAFAGVLALTLNSKQKFFAAVLILVVISGFIVSINRIKKTNQIKKLKRGKR